MKCGKCGAELDPRMRRSDGSIQCPYCGTTNRTRASRSSALIAADDEQGENRVAALLHRIPWEVKVFGLAYRNWCLIGLALLLIIGISAVAVSVSSRGSRDPVIQQNGDITTIPTRVPTANDAVEIASTVAPTEAVAADATPVPGARTTGVTLPEFMQRFAQGMAYLKQTGNPTDSGTNESGNGTVTIDANMTMDYRLNNNGELTTLRLICRGDGSTLSVYRIAAATVSAIYGFDPSFNGAAGLQTAQAVLQGQEYTGASFVAKGEIINTNATVSFSGTR